MALGNPSRPDDDLGRNTWSGEITGDITGDMHFYKTDGKNVGNVRHYWEIWLITDSQGEMLLMGTDKGVWSPANYKYRMNGVVTDAAPSYEYLIGHNVHMSGDIIPGPDEWLGPGVFRVN
jgi:hypothetical protein